MWIQSILLISPVLFDILKLRMVNKGQDEFSVASLIFPGNTTAIPKYTLDETVSLEKFRPLALDILKENRRKPLDSYLLRWLRDSDLDVKSATMLLNEAHNWRKANGMENILNETIWGYKSKPIRLEGTDKEGNPIMIFTIKGQDIRKYLLAGQREKIERYIYQMMERVEDKLWQLSHTTGKDISQCVLLVDANGYNLKDHGCLNCLSVYMNTFLRAFKYYPRVATYAAVINAPTVAKPFVDLAMKVFPEYARRTIKVFGARKEEYEPYLLNRISSDQLPIAFGGERELN